MLSIRDRLRLKIGSNMESSRILGQVKMLEGVSIKNTLSLHNRKCHLNSYDLYMNNNNLIPKMCWTMENNDNSNGFVHFINYDKDNNEYTDNTLGASSRNYTYYILNPDWLINDLKKDDPNPSNWLYWGKEDIINLNFNFIEKWFINKSEV